MNVNNHPTRSKRRWFACRASWQVFTTPLLILALPHALDARPGDRDSPRLFIHGGGQLGKLMDTFHEMAGPNARRVVIPSALENPNPEALPQTTPLPPDP